MRGNRAGDRDARAWLCRRSARRRRPSRCCSGRRSASASPAISSSRRWRSPNRRAAATCATCARGPTRRLGKDADWIIDGHKMWIGNGGIANVHVVNAVVDEELGHRGQALFIVPGGTPGLEMVRKLDKLGCRASHTAELKFNAVRVPGENLLGGQEKLEHKLARAREAVEGGKHSGSATMGTFEQTRPDGRRAGARHRQGRNGIRDRIREPSRGVRRADHRQPGHRLPAGRPGHRDRRRAPADLAGVLDGRHRRADRARRGIDVEAGRQRGRRPDHRTRDPDDGRLGLHQGPPGGEVVPGCQAVHHFRGHQRDPAGRHLQRARRRRRQATAARRPRTHRWPAEPDVRPRHAGPHPGGQLRAGDARRVSRSRSWRWR